MRKQKQLQLVLSACLLIAWSVSLSYGGAFTIIGQGSPKPEKGNKLGNGFIYVTENGRQATGVRIQTLGSSLYVAKIKVFFEGGRTLEVPVGVTIAVEEEADVINIGAHPEPIEKIMIRFRSARQATIVLWGR